MTTNRLVLEILTRVASMAAAVGMFATGIVGHIRWGFAPQATALLCVAAILLFAAAVTTKD